MAISKNSQISWIISLLIAFCYVSLPAYAKYSGGTGEQNDPYQIATADDLIALGETPEDYDKHFILTADIDLDPNLPGRKVFDKAVIASITIYDWGRGWDATGTPFTGVFDGYGHMISHLTIKGKDYVGLFGCLVWPAEVRNLGVVDVDITGSQGVGGLVGYNGATDSEGCYTCSGVVTQCHSTGVVSGDSCVGGLVGWNIWNEEGDSVTESYSTAAVSGTDCVGGLVGSNDGAVIHCYSTGVVSASRSYSWGGVGGLVGDNCYGVVTQCYSIGAVSGRENVGGLVGYNPGGYVTNCYSSGAVSGTEYIGGLVGRNSQGTVTHSYSIGAVTGTGQDVGGLVGSDYQGQVIGCFWDTQTSGQTKSAGGHGRGTAAMQTAATFYIWVTCGNDGIWTIDEGRDYPRLWWQNAPGKLIVFASSLHDLLTGDGTEESPFLVRTAEELCSVGLFPFYWDRHYKLMSDIDLSAFDGKDGRPVFNVIGTSERSPFTGVFDGNGHAISHLTIKGGRCMGLFGQMTSGAEVRDLGVVDVNITDSADCVGGLVGSNGGAVIHCYSTGTVSASDRVGGLAGSNRGDVQRCWSVSEVHGTGYSVGGLMGGTDGTVNNCWSNSAVSGCTFAGGLMGSNGGDVTRCYSAGTVSGTGYVGGLVGYNSSTVTHSYSASAVSATGTSVGGLVGCHDDGSVTRCYSIGEVKGNNYVGGLVGSGDNLVWDSVWNVETSGQSGSAGGVGLTTAEMMDPYMLGLNGFAGDPNWVLDANHDYPRLAWEGTPGGIIPEPVIDWLTGKGTAEDPHPIDTAQQLIFLGRAGVLCDRHFVLGADIDLDPNLTNGQIFSQAVIPTFTGVFDGNKHVISNLVVEGGSRLGVFGYLASPGEVRDLGVEYVHISGSGGDIGGLVGQNHESVLARCYSTGVVSGQWGVGGLVGLNGWPYASAVTLCYSTAAVSGTDVVGGLVGYNSGTVNKCCSRGAVRGTSDVGGLMGRIYGGLASECYSTGAVIGQEQVGGLVGYILWGNVTQCYSTGAVSGTKSVGGLVGDNDAFVYLCFWDIETSGQSISAGGTGKTTGKMQMASTFLDAGWDFVGETTNGTEDIWWIDEGKDYPHLWWEASDL